MRLLLLLSAFLTALTGAVSGVANAAEPIQASASVSPAGSRVTLETAMPRAGTQTFSTATAWHVAAAAATRGARAPFGERRRL